MPCKTVSIPGSQGGSGGIGGGGEVDNNARSKLILGAAAIGSIGYLAMTTQGADKQ